MKNEKPVKEDIKKNDSPALIDTTKTTTTTTAPTKSITSTTADSNVIHSDILGDIYIPSSSKDVKTENKQNVVHEPEQNIQNNNNVINHVMDNNLPPQNVVRFNRHPLPKLPTYTPYYTSSLHNSTSIPDNSTNDNNENSLSDTSCTNTENSLVDNKSKDIFEYNEDDEVLSPKSGWSLWWSSFGKDDKKEKESSEGSTKRNNKSPFSFFKYTKSSSSTSLVDKAKNFNQGKGITKTYILDVPLVLKPLNRTTEDAIYTISHSKLATTYRPMIQQVFITSIMRQYISKYQDSPFIVPFKKARPPKKRRISQILYQGNNQGNNIRPPLPLPSPTSHGKPVNRGKGRARRPLPANNPPLIFGRITEDASHNKRPSTYKKPKLVDVDDSNLDELLERGIDFDDNDTGSKKSSKGHSKRKGKKKKSNAIYKNIKNSISVDQIDYINRSSKKVKKKKSSSSMNNTNDYEDEYDRGYFARRGHVRRSSSSSSSSSNSSYSSSSSSSSGEDDDVPLAILRSKRTSIITI